MAASHSPSRVRELNHDCVARRFPRRGAAVDGYPPSAIHGMLAGIGAQIALAQLHVLLGGDPESSAIANVRALPRQVLDLHGRASIPAW